jgi:hypothetical protein
MEEEEENCKLIELSLQEERRKKYKESVLKSVVVGRSNLRNIDPFYICLLL